MNESSGEENSRQFSWSIIAEARQSIAEREEARSRKFWNEHPDVLYHLKTVSTLRELNVPSHFSKAMFLTRLLFPISPTIQTFQQLLNSVLSELSTLSKPLLPNESNTARIIQTLRVLLHHQKTRDCLLHLLEKDEPEPTQTSMEASNENGDFSLKSLFIRCINFPSETAAKEEAIYFVATMAMDYPDASMETINDYLYIMIKAYQDSMHFVDDYISFRHKAKEQHEIDKVTARFQIKTISRFVPTVFTYPRYKHTGKFAGHRYRSLCLFTIAIMMHFWREKSLVKLLMLQSLKCQRVSRLYLLMLVRIVLDNWPSNERRSLVTAISEPMKKMLDCKADCQELGEKKAIEIINECHKRYRVIKKYLLTSKDPKRASQSFEKIVKVKVKKRISENFASLQLKIK